MLKVMAHFIVYFHRHRENKKVSHDFLHTVGEIQWDFQPPDEISFKQSLLLPLFSLF